jgi:hypothetical protein
LSTLYDVGEANDIYFADELTDQYAALKRYGDFVAFYDIDTPCVENLEIVCKPDDKYTSSNSETVVLRSYCGTRLAIHKIYNSLDSFNIGRRRNLDLSEIDFSEITTHCVYNITSAVWNEIITLIPRGLI